jgi:hypothetical protein
MLNVSKLSDKMKIAFERDSICPGDDMFVPHLKTFSFAKPPFLSELFDGGLVVNYLPCVSGTKTIWVAMIEGTCVARIEHCCYTVRRTKVELLVEDKPMWATQVFFQADGQEQLK